MKTLMKTLIFLLIMAIASVAYSADVSLSWSASPGATGYKVYMSLDGMATWDLGIDVGNVTAYIYTGVPDTGNVHFRYSAYDMLGPGGAMRESVRYNAFNGYCGDCGPPPAQTGLVIE